MNTMADNRILWRRMLALLALVVCLATLAAADCGAGCLNGGACQASGVCSCGMSYTGARCEVLLVCNNATGDYLFTGKTKDTASMAQYTLPPFTNTTDMTVCAWEYRTTPSSEDFIFGIGLNGANNVALHFGFATQCTQFLCLRFSIYGGGNDLDANTPDLYVANTWHHVCATMRQDSLNPFQNTTIVTIYVDGAVRTYGTIGLFLGTDRTAIVGRKGPDWPSPSNFDGHLRDVRLYMRGLSDQDILAIYTNGAPASESGLVLWLPFAGSLTDASPAKCPLLTSATTNLPTSSYVPLGPSLATGTPFHWTTAIPTTGCAKAQGTNLQCLNGGMSLDGNTCSCLLGWTGPNCGINADLCTAAQHQCQNGGTCDEYTVKCGCTAFYNGVSCEINAVCDPKNGHPCVNGGSCVWPSMNTSQCACVAGFGGDQCQIDLCEQAGHKCTNGGVCNAAAKCVCPAGYFGGDACEVALTCNPQSATPCLNGGTCVLGADRKSACFCGSSFTGARCEVSNMCLMTTGDMQFDGASYLTYTLPTGLNGISFTMCAWAKRASSSPTEYLIGIGTSGNTDVALHFGFTGTNFGLNFYGDDYQFTLTASSFLQWHHYCAVFTTGSSNVKNLYVDGASIGTKSGGSAFKGTDTVVQIGRDGFSNSRFTGRARDFRIWSRVLSDAELKQVYYGGLGNDAGLLLALPATADYSDFSANGLFPTANWPIPLNSGFASMHPSMCSVAALTNLTCVNGGFSADGSTCSCPAGFAPPTCAQPFDPCQSAGHACQNNGTCTFSTAKCACPSGFGGLSCEFAVACPKPCMNGGSCVTDGSATAAGVCACLPSYGGDVCQVAVECLPSVGDATFAQGANSNLQYTLPSNIYRKSFTACAWTKRNSVTSDDDWIMGLGGRGGGGNDKTLHLGFSVTSPGYIRFSWWSSDCDLKPLPSDIADTNWHYICGVFNVTSTSGSVTGPTIIFADGTLRTQCSSRNSFQAYDTLLAFGRQWADSHNFDGRMRGARFYGRGLSADEIMALYTNGALPPASDANGLLMFSPMTASYADVANQRAPAGGASTVFAFSTDTVRPTGCSTCSINGRQCQNGGICANGTDCSCLPGFAGTLCETATSDICSFNGHPCQNNGVCNQKTATCVCTEGFTGPTCDDSVQMWCYPNGNSPCINGGVCAWQSGNYVCTCPPSYAGKQCEVPQMCALTSGDYTFSDAAGSALQFQLPRVINGTAYTMCAWAKRRYLSNEDNIISVGTTASAGRVLYLAYTAQNKLRVGVYGTDCDATVTADLNWHHVCGTMATDTMTATVYFDGVPAVSCPAASMQAQEPLLFVGRRGDQSSGRFDGRLRDVRMYLRALSANEVSTLNMSGVLSDVQTIDAQGMLLMLPFTSTVADMSGNALPLQLSVGLSSFTTGTSTQHVYACNKCSVSDLQCVNDGICFDGRKCTCPHGQTSPTCADPLPPPPTPSSTAPPPTPTAQASSASLVSASSGVASTAGGKSTQTPASTAVQQSTAAPNPSTFSPHATAVPSSTLLPPPIHYNNTDSSSSSLSDGAIAGIVIGSVAGAVLIIVIVYCAACAHSGVSRGKSASTGATTGTNAGADSNDTNFKAIELPTSPAKNTGADAEPEAAHEAPVEEQKPAEEEAKPAEEEKPADAKPAEGEAVADQA